MIKKTHLLAVGFAVGITGLANVSHATVLTFDDIASDQVGVIPDDYGGFDWEQFGYVNGGTHSPGSGYDNGTVSGDYTAFNEFGSTSTASAAPFDFNGAYLTAAWNTGLNIRVQGLDGGTVLYDTTVVVDTTGPTWFDFDYEDIGLLEFSSFGGTDAVNEDGGSGTHFALDNFTFNEVTDVPAPSTLLLLGVGMAALGFVGRVRHRIAVPQD